jgi:iron complex transport system ATP-binding protein
MPLPLIEVSGLVVERDSLILRGIDWRMSPGEHWVILGSNGSGKTSLLRALTGYLMPTSGSVAVCGKVFGEFDWRELRKRVGLVSSAVRQMIEDMETAVEVVVSGKDAVLNYWGSIAKKDRLAAKKLLRQMEAANLEDRPWLFLSQGERQRVLIGRALMARAKLLILDEPCAGLDPVAREHFLHFLQRTASGKFPVPLVLVTHHVEEIIPVFTHVLVLKEGRVLAAGPKAQVLRSEILSEAFGAKVKLRRQGESYRMDVI